MSQNVWVAFVKFIFRAVIVNVRRSNKSTVLTNIPYLTQYVEKNVQQKLINITWTFNNLTFNRYNNKDSLNIQDTNSKSVEYQTFFKKQSTKQKIFTPRLV